MNRDRQRADVDDCICIGRLGGDIRVAVADRCRARRQREWSCGFRRNGNREDSAGASDVGDAKICGDHTRVGDRRRRAAEDHFAFGEGDRVVGDEDEIAAVAHDAVDRKCGVARRERRRVSRVRDALRRRGESCCVAERRFRKKLGDDYLRRRRRNRERCNGRLEKNGRWNRIEFAVAVGVDRRWFRCA